jgi:cysteine desulfurase
MEQRPLYFDANATTPVHPEVLSLMRPYLEEEFGNPSSSHRWGQKAKNAVDEARFQTAAVLGCSTTEVVFTSSGTEANNLAILGFFSAEAEKRESPLKRLDAHCVTTMIEHGSTLDTFRWLENWGIGLTRVAPDRSGRVSAEAVAAALRPNTILISVMQVNNETGVVQPVQAISALARDRGIAFHIDAVQGTGKLPVSADSLGGDFITLAAHKAEGPKGCGVLYVRRGRRLSPILHGGSMDGNIRGGTHDVPAIVGCGAALIRSDSYRLESAGKAPLRDRFEAAVLRGIPDAAVNGAGADRVWNTSNISFPGVPGEALLARLDLAGLAASRGSACAAGNAKPSHVLAAMDLPRELVNSAIRFSFLPSVTEGDIDRGVEITVACVQGLRKR